MVDKGVCHPRVSQPFRAVLTNGGRESRLDEGLRALINMALWA
jgi:hypothetical protein